MSRSAKLLDSHIHLWPSTSTSPLHHGWMSPGHPLAQRHGISDYRVAVRAASPAVSLIGFVYVETDRYLATSSPRISDDGIEAVRADDSETNQGVRAELEAWAAEPLEELRFLRRIVEGKSNGESDGFDAGDGATMLAAVVWAPLHLPPPVFRIYLELAAEAAGAELWSRVAGFRYLLQGIRSEADMRKLVEHPDWVDNLLSLSQGRAGKGWSFDIAVDTRSRGVWQIEIAADMVEKIRRIEESKGAGTVKFILNHLCKPDLAHVDSPTITGWTSALQRLASFSCVYMKLSGGFSEFGDSAPASVPEIIQRIEYYANTALEMFGPNRVMFGSDWPVCNVGGPLGDKSWAVWKEVVERLLSHENRYTDAQKESVWCKTAGEAYGIDS